MSNRKLIRLNPSELKERLPSARSSARRKPAPPEQTIAETFYYLKQMNARTRMVVVLLDGEELHGVIEWYDRACIKVNRDDGPNLLVMKHQIKYMFKAEELREQAREGAYAEPEFERA